MTFPEQRKSVIREAMTWKNTPFEYNQCIKASGVDCGRLIASSLNGSGVKQIDIASLPKLSPQWFMHENEVNKLRSAGGSFLDIICRFAVEYRLDSSSEWNGVVKKTPETGDIVVAECFLDWAHSALVVEWPSVIAAVCEHKVSVLTNIFRFPQYMNRKLKFFDPWGK